MNRGFCKTHDQPVRAQGQCHLCMMGASEAKHKDDDGWFRRTVNKNLREAGRGKYNKKRVGVRK